MISPCVPGNPGNPRCPIEKSQKIVSNLEYYRYFNVKKGIARSHIPFIPVSPISPRSPLAPSAPASPDFPLIPI